MKSLSLFLATANTHKAREIRDALGETGWEITTAPPEATDVDETEDSFEANARLKAMTVAQAVGAVALADDSGLEVDALDGAPGVQSRRWAGPDATDGDRIHRLLDALRYTPDEQRSARFVCAACIAGPDGVLWEGRGTVEGMIGRIPAGENGFGYDPVFLLSDGRTMAQLSSDEKNAISHRGRAMALAGRWLRESSADNIQ